MGRYINPFTDWGFKRLFGQEFSKDLLISFLNDLFEGELQIKDVTFKDKEQLAETKDLRGCIFDVFCTTDDGKHFIVEMQNRRVPLFVNRTVYYACKAIVAQRDQLTTKPKPDRYQLVPVYTVCFMNFLPKEEDEVKNFKTDVMLRDNSGAVFSDKLRFIYLSLPLFKKKAEECESDFEKWIYVLKHMELMDRMPFVAKKKIFERLAEIADSSCLSKEEREKYEESRKVADDWYSSMYGAWEEGNEKGFKEGNEKGFKKGIKEGIKEGIEKGIKKGETRRNLAIAKNLLSMNLSIAQIMQATGLTKEQIDSLEN